MPPEAVQRNVIVADDSVIIRDIVRLALGEPWRIFLAADGPEALDYARSVQAEMVLLDFQMPRLNGIETCLKLRSLPGYAKVPVALLTAYDSVDLRRRAREAGISAVFTKPFSANALRSALLPLIAAGRDAARPGAASRAGAASSAPAWPTVPVAPGDPDLAAGRDMLAVYRKVEAAADQQRQGSFAELMAARHAKARR
jgi:two-component system chemotaxis response regulator CheY